MSTPGRIQASLAFAAHLALTHQGLLCGDFDADATASGANACQGGRPPAQCQPSAVAQSRRSTRDDEVVDLVDLLMDHADPAAGTASERAWVAEQLAVASLGDDHLWQDLTLPSRRELSQLFGRWFPALAAKNTQDMKWKKFLYKQLCEREELFICKAPSCSVCTDRPVCFGPES